MTRRDSRDDVLTRHLDFVARGYRLQLTGQAPAVELGELPQDPLHRLDRLGRHVDHRRRHLHHSPACNVHGQRDDVVQMAVRHEPRLCSHERPWLRAQVEAQLQLRESPVGLHGRTRVTLNRQVAVLECLDGQVVDHRMRQDTAEKQQFGRKSRYCRAKRLAVTVADEEVWIVDSCSLIVVGTASRRLATINYPLSPI
jgi:hypothetical protein